MDCRSARQLLDFFRPPQSDLAPEDVDALEKHLAGCAECDEMARAERRLDHQLGKAIRNVPVPHGLKTQILNRLASDRRDSYRRLATRIASGAIAAALLLFLGFGVLWPDEQPAPSSDGICQDVLAKVMSNDRDLPSTNSSAKLDRWAPPPAQLKSHPKPFASWAVLEGQLVPVYTYHSQTSDATARVYVLSPRQFDFRNLKNGYVHPSGDTWQVRVLLEPELGYAYVIAYTKNSFDEFLKTTN